MAAPVVAVVVALLTGGGGGGGVAVAPWVAGLVKGEAVVAGVYLDVGATCKATDPLIDGLDDLYPGSADLARLAAVADAVCAAAAKPNTPINHAALVVAAVQALQVANAKLAAANPPPVPAPQPAWRQHVGR